MIRLRLASCAMLALLPAMAATGGGSGEGIIIEQVQLGNQGAWLDVHVPDFADAATAASTAASNAASSLVEYGDNAYAVRQSSQGNVSSATGLTGGHVYGPATVATTAYGNSSQATTQNGTNYYRAKQVMDGDTSANTRIALQGAGSVNSATVAAANVSVSGARYGNTHAFHTQEANGSVRAATDAVICCITESANLATLAAGNVASSTGWSSTTFDGAVQSTGFDGAEITATSDVYSASASNVTGSATAAGNSFVMQNEWGSATLGRQGSELYQGNGATITATSAIELDHWSGTAASIAYGAGNTALATNVGADTGLYAIQSNFAGVDANASLAGQSWTGGAGQVIATAVGNTAGATLCTICGEGSLHGSVTQYNQGSIGASADINTPVAGHVSASASAIGNAATFSARGP